MEPSPAAGSVRSGPRPIVVGVLGAGLAAVVVGIFLFSGDGGIDRFIHASPEHTDPAATSVALVPEGEGFDGQFYLRLAAEPFSDATRVEGVAFDLPSVRSARVGYPLVAGGVGLVPVGALPVTLVAVNVAAAGFVAGSAAALARVSRRSTWWGLVALAFPGFVYTIGFDLAELVEAALVVLAVIAMRREHTIAAAVALGAALLTRETAYALPAGIAALTCLSYLWPRARAWRPPRTAVVATAAALAVGGAWQVVELLRYDEMPLLGSADKNIRLPFAGMWAARDELLPTSGENLFRVGSLLVLLVVVALALDAARRAPHAGAAYEVAALLVALVAATLLSSFVWEGATSFMRGLTEAWVLSVVILLTRPWSMPLAPPVFAVASVGGTAVTVLAEVGKRV